MPLGNVLFQGLRIPSLPPGALVVSLQERPVVSVAFLSAVRPSLDLDEAD